MESRKAAICDALARWIKQRPGLEYGNYGDPTSYRAECRSISRDKREAETLLAAVRWRPSITADDLIKAAQGAFSGRLSITLTPYPCLQAKIDYCTGQYWPTEYRKAVCAVLASALWDYTCEHGMPPVEGYRVESWSELGKGRTLHSNHDTREAANKHLEELGGSSYGHVCEIFYDDRMHFVSAGDWLRRYFLREFGRGIASRWFR